MKCYRLLQILKYIKKIWRDGGVTQVNIAQISYGKILAGKRVLITGGSSGIGLAIAKKCLSEGAMVVVTGRNREKLESVAAELKTSLLHVLEWDIGNISIRDKKLSEAIDLVGGRIDILVNNAGILLAQPFSSTTEMVWDQTYAVNSKGPFFLIQELSNLWIKKGDCGKIINISSTGGFLGALHPYRMTKWDIVGLTAGLGELLARRGIIMNGIAPGRTATKMLGRNDGDVYDAELPLCRMGLPEEIAELALFLMSDAANYIVGQTIICDGGYTLKT